jgi:hypothetical protein
LCFLVWRWSSISLGSLWGIINVEQQATQVTLAISTDFRNKEPLLGISFKSHVLPTF